MSATSTLDSTAHSFVPPTSSDVRSPCPALNALANHGYINHNGRNITISQLVEAMQRVYNITKPLAYLLAVTGVFLLGHRGSVDLDRLAKHNVIEHNASFSRRNAQPPNEYAPIEVDPNLVAQLMQMSSKDYLTLSDFAAARVLREAQAGPVDSIHEEIAKGESSLILQVFGGEELEVPKDILSTWFIDERLPDGWEPPKKAIGILSTRSLAGQIASAADNIRNVERG